MSNGYQPKKQIANPIPPQGGTGVIKHRDNIKVDIETENLKLRELLWLRHGCELIALYGDDGEMQCGRCLIDFKRFPIDTIRDCLRIKT